ncbi:CDP-glycerol glycerophosphotransferase family protein [Candidatus Daviesbacteria bacterium]|nr:CDP-glycerol glycerophosphotransferase family protein [Candidatus Daviesbacteria bacterium]
MRTELTERQANQVNTVHLPALGSLPSEKGLELYLPINSYQSNGTIPREYHDRQRIIWGVYDEGAYKAGIPVIELLLADAVDVFVVAGGAASRSLQGKIDSLGLRATRFSPSKDLMRLTGDLVVSGSDPTKHLEQVLIAQGISRGERTIKYEDNSPFMAYYDRVLARQGLLVVPDFAFFASERSLEQSIKYVSAYQGRGVVVGNPADDRFFYEDTEENYERVRKELGVEDDEWFIVYAATKTEATFHTGNDLVQHAIKELDTQRYKFTFRVHPNEYNDPLIAARYAGVLESLGNHGVDTMIRNKDGRLRYSMDEIRQAADIVVTDTSTTGREAIFDKGMRGGKGPRLVVHAMIPANMRLRPEWTNELPPDPSVVLDGSSAVVRGWRDFPRILNSIINDRATRERMWAASRVWKQMNDGRSTERFANKILEIVSV